ncbi:AAA family ATPase [Runella sp.]|uniref:AAA family ATPase n=1 Tax=Runella sp. TaxID=1960881 RepID=UPI003D144A3A
MKICKIIIKDFHQFKDFELDLTHPETGEPLDKVCFIGSNGTGKTKTLKIIDTLLNPTGKSKYLLYCKVITVDRELFWIVLSKDNRFIFSSEIEKLEDWQTRISRDVEYTETLIYKSNVLDPALVKYLILDKNIIEQVSPDLQIYVPSETENNQFIELSDVPITNVDEALRMFQDFPVYNIVSNETISDFWKTLIYYLKKRENDFQNFQNLEENQSQTVRMVRLKFNQQNPDILKEIAIVWDSILSKAGLEFDVSGASNPIQLTDNLKAYIKLKSTGKHINYSELSTGIRNFIFKVGHIYSLYFTRDITRGLLLIDEPENSLFPDFLYELVDIYKSIIFDTQIFMATHNPIIAAQFEPYERFILEFDDHGYVKARRGTVPVGDDPNDILSKDFGVRSLLGKEGVKKWERYIELRTLIRLTQDAEEKSRLLDEFIKIGNEYNFSNALS